MWKFFEVLYKSSISTILVYRPLPFRALSSTILVYHMYPLRDHASAAPEHCNVRAAVSGKHKGPPAFRDYGYKEGGPNACHFFTTSNKLPAPHTMPATMTPPAYVSASSNFILHCVTCEPRLCTTVPGTPLSCRWHDDVPCLRMAIESAVRDRVHLDVRVEFLLFCSMTRSPRSPRHIDRQVPVPTVPVLRSQLPHASPPYNTSIFLPLIPRGCGVAAASPSSSTASSPSQRPSPSGRAAPSRGRS